MSSGGSTSNYLASRCCNRLCNGAHPSPTSNLRSRGSAFNLSSQAFPPIFERYSLRQLPTRSVSANAWSVISRGSGSSLLMAHELQSYAWEDRYEAYSSVHCGACFRVVPGGLAPSLVDPGCPWSGPGRHRFYLSATHDHASIQGRGV